MSFLGSVSRQSQAPSVPTGEVVATSTTYAGARAAVDVLVQQAEFPVAGVAIVGTDLATIERVTGRMSFARAAFGSLGSGLMLGLFVGLLLMITNPTIAPGTLIAVLLVAIGFSVIWSVISYAVGRRRRQFTSFTQVIARRFDVVVSAAEAGRARSALGTLAAPVGTVVGGERPAASPAAPAPVAPAQGGATTGSSAPDRLAASSAPPAWMPSGDGDRVDGSVPGGAPGQPIGGYGAAAPTPPAPSPSSAQGAGAGADAAGRAPGSASSSESAASRSSRPRTYGEAQDALRRRREAERLHERNLAASRPPAPASDEPGSSPEAR